jgi:hypothetical protein
MSLRTRRPLGASLASPLQYRKDMRIARTLAILLGLLTLVPAAARAVTIDQIVAMSRAGVSDAVIIATIEHDRSVFTLDPAQLVELQKAGVTDTVAVAMIKSGEAREQTSVATPAPAPQAEAAPAPPAEAAPPEAPMAAPEPSVVVVYAVPYVVPRHAHQSRVVVAAPVVAAPVAVHPVQAAAAPARGMFFTQPSTGIFFQPPADANCPLPPKSPHRR